MTNNINLVSNQTAASVKEKNRLKIVRISASVSLAVVALISIFIFIVNSQISLSSIKKDENSTIQSISFLNKKTAKLAIINNRLKDITNIMQKRRNYRRLISKFTEIMPGGVYPLTLEIDKNDILLIVNSNSLLLLDKFLNNTNELSLKKSYINGLSIESLTVNEKQGNYSLALRLKMI